MVAINNFILLAVLWVVFCFTPLEVEAYGKYTMPAVSQSFVFIENSDGGYFVASSDGQRSIIEGANVWNDELKTERQQLGLGLMSQIINQSVMRDSYYDMWIENSPVSYPLTGLACDIRSAPDANCNLTASIVQPQASSVIDENGFYGVAVSGALPEHGGTLSSSFYSYLKQMAVGSSFTITINQCWVGSADYVNRCANDYSSGFWYSTKVTFTKSAHMKVLHNGETDEVFINSDGVPTPGDGNVNCKVQIVNTQSGMVCKLLDYTQQSTGQINSWGVFYPMMFNWPLVMALAPGDMLFSPDGSRWVDTLQYAQKSVSYKDLQSSGSFYIFFSNNYFKKMVELGNSDTNIEDILDFRFANALGIAVNSGRSVWSLPVSNSLVIKPREFSISITSDDYSNAPVREGYVGSSQPSLDFNYIVTTSGKTAADEVQIKVTGPTEIVNGRPHCIFSSSEPVDRVPFPATLSFMTQDGKTKTYDVGCDGNWRDMTDALWLSSAWTDISGLPGVMDKATVKFSILMNDIISTRTLGRHSGWYGEMNASGEVHVKATWRDIN
ncbi:Fimbria adhesin EcpD [Klebsiella huaxiensis]|uniref:Fimbria adhesin EcpD n=1 Tax=Klebsiella huaxiensis TaxID=2153354 RepID=A0A564GV20_9ENTR|nr:Fimbria adhesin EcpD [Klebsiella huaxiensis]